MPDHLPVDEKLGRFQSDARQSWALPGRFYFDPEVYAAEKEAIFYRSWQWVGHESQLGDSGDYITAEIGDESVMVLRDRDGALRAFFNVCQHRAHRLVEGEGKLKSVITCPYHAWAYGLDGALRTARGSEELPNFDKKAFCLTAVRVESFCGFLFVNMDDDAVPLAETHAAFANHFLSFGSKPEQLHRAARSVVDIKANWKNVIENYAECLHCANAHPSLATAALDMAHYRIETFDHYQVHTSINCGEDQGYRLEIKEGSRDGDFASWLLFPNLVLEYYPGGKLTVFHNTPLGPEITRQTCEWYLPAAQVSENEQEIIDFVDVVRREDIPIVESVQKGLHSRGYRRGAFMIDRVGSGASEHAVHDFQKKVLTALGYG